MATVWDRIVVGDTNTQYKFIDLINIVGECVSVSVSPFLRTATINDVLAAMVGVATAI